MKDGVFLQPSEGQSLRSFLSSQDFHTCAELDKVCQHYPFLPEQGGGLMSVEFQNIECNVCQLDGNTSSVCLSAGLLMMDDLTCAPLWNILIILINTKPVDGMNYKIRINYFQVQRMS